MCRVRDGNQRTSIPAKRRSSDILPRLSQEEASCTQRQLLNNPDDTKPPLVGGFENKSLVSLIQPFSPRAIAAFFGAMEPLLQSNPSIVRFDRRPACSSEARGIGGSDRVRSDKHQTICERIWAFERDGISHMHSNGNIPTMLYDGDCGFCKQWIERWRKVTKDTVRYVPYQEAVSDYPQLTREDCERAVQLILPDGRAYSGVHAAFHAFAIASRYRWLLWFYEYVPAFDWVAEAIYQWIARHRASLSKISQRGPTCRS